MSCRNDEVYRGRGDKVNICEHGGISVELATYLLSEVRYLSQPFRVRAICLRGVPG